MRRWNWAAFSLNIIWGVFHKCYWTFICFIPVVGIFWMFICGFQGDKWAWKNGHYESMDDYKNKEFIWDVLGILATIVIVINLISYFVPSASNFRLY